MPPDARGKLSRRRRPAAGGVAGAATSGSRPLGNCAESADLPDNPARPLEDAPAFSAGSSVFFRTIRTRLSGETESAGRDGGAAAAERAFLCRFVCSSHRAAPFIIAAGAS
jgi:hypothetical protein